MRLSDMGRIKEILTAYQTLEETQEAMAKEFPSVKVTYNTKRRVISLVDTDE
jgi:hypothetical protein